MDVLCQLIGTRFAPVPAFLERYKDDGFIWTLESCEMNAAHIYRTLWQMRECGWFKYCHGIIYGRPDGYSDSMDFTLTDALLQGLGELNVPVIYNADIGHIPPQMQIINGDYGKVEYRNGCMKIMQEYRAQIKAKVYQQVVKAVSNRKRIQKGHFSIFRKMSFP